MPLDGDTFKSGLKAAYINAQGMDNADDAVDYLAGEMKDLIIALIESGDVAFTSGQIVGTCAGPGNPLTAGAGTGGKMT